MALPEDWNGVDWNTSITILPGVTQGVKSVPINRDKAPHAQKGYYMFATTYNASNPMCHNVLDATAGEPVVLYIASDVADGGSLVSQFVFMHEIGHLRLGHITGLPASDTVSNPGTGIPTSFRNEVDADVYSLNHWITQRTYHGVKVIWSAIQKLKTMNSAGDDAHPSSMLRGQFLELLLNQKTCIVFLLNDNAISVDFARAALTDFAQQLTGTLNIEHVLTTANSSGRAAITGSTTIENAIKLLTYTSTKPSLYTGLQFEIVPN